MVLMLTYYKGESAKGILLTRGTEVTRKQSSRVTLVGKF